MPTDKTNNSFLFNVSSFTQYGYETRTVVLRLATVLTFHFGPDKKSAFIKLITICGLHPGEEDDLVQSVDNLREIKDCR